MIAGETPHSETEGPKRFFLLLGLAILVRAPFAALHVTRPDLSMYYDAAEYHQIAVNLLSRYTYSCEVSPPFATDANRPPLYPLFLAGIYSISHNSLEAVAWTQNGLDILVVC